MSAEKSLKVTSGELVNQAPLIPVRNLMKEGKTGTLAEGAYEGKFDGKYGPEYRIRGTDGTLFVVPNNQAVREQLDGVLPGISLRLQYNGKKTTKTGRSFHDIEFFAK
jgi:hypothetical protein